MHISKVSLVNYRNFANANFKFNKGINTIIGENGSGKSNVFKAIRLLLEDASFQYAFKLTDGDFNRSIGDWRGHWIIISIEFDNISADEAIQALFVHGSGVIDKKNFVTKATYNLFFRPKADIRHKLSELKEGDKEGLTKILSSLTIKDNYETIFTGKSTADFTDKESYKELVGDFDKVVFPERIDTSKFGIKLPPQLSVSKEISFTFIQALRDVVTDFHNNRTNPLLTLLKNKSGEIKEAEYKPINDLVIELNGKIEQLPDVQNIRSDIKITIKDAVGETYSPSSLSIKSSLPNEADKLLQSLKLFIGEPDETYEGGIHELSLGGANLIFLTLKLLEYKYRKTKETFANFLLIEEPEAHLHTHIQKTLFDNLDYGDTQIIYSTHSIQIAEVSNVLNINILAKKQNFAEVYHPSYGLDPKNITQIQRYLDAVRTNLLFAKGVLLVEGDAEEILIPLLIKKVFGLSLDELGISLINIRSTGFENVAQLFHNDRIKRFCSIVTDLDAAICVTVITPGEDADITSYKRKVANSESTGAERKKRLDEFCDKNEWIAPFYADHTFEVDFIKTGNSSQVQQLINKVYKGPATQAKAKAELQSNDISLYGKRVLTMANQEGKGWFAILLGEEINHKTLVPDYIVKAIMFAKSTFSKYLIADILSYRIGKNLEDNPILDFKNLQMMLSLYASDLEGLPDVINEFEKIAPGDAIMKFLKSL